MSDSMNGASAWHTLQRRSVTRWQLDAAVEVTYDRRCAHLLLLQLRSTLIPMLALTEFQ